MLARFMISSLFYLVSISSLAVGLTVTPTNLHISPSHKTAVLTLVNKSNKPVNLQVFIKKWDQDDLGKTQLSDSDHLVVYPKLLTLAAGASRPIRIGYQKGWSDIEQSFRILIDELPAAKNNNEGVSIFMPVRLSIPVFLNKNNQKQAPQIAIFSAKKQGKFLQIGIHNKGLKHVKIKKISADLFDKNNQALTVLTDAGWYLLPQKQVFFNLPWQASICQQATEAHIEVQIKNEIEKNNLSILPDNC